MTRAPLRLCMIASALGLAALTGAPAQAATIAWTDWTSVFPPAALATGSIDAGTPVSVTYVGSMYPSGGVTNATFRWGPSTTYVGGSVGNAPCTGTSSCAGDIIFLDGNPPTMIRTITFSQAVVDPVFAVWSVGQSGVPVTFSFTSGTPSVQSTGPNGSFGFVSLTASGNQVSGQEGNGTFVLAGTFTTISFTTTVESYYGFTVGITGLAPVSTVPEPGTWALLAAGLGVLGFSLRRRRAGA